ncbi:hypothetical protein Tco_0737619 [Tanacetum coccineum]
MTKRCLSDFLVTEVDACSTSEFSVPIILDLVAVQSCDFWLLSTTTYSRVILDSRSQLGSGGGRGVKEKSLNRNSMNTSSGIGTSTESDDTLNDDTPVGIASTVKEGVTPSMVDMMVDKEKISSLQDTIVLEFFFQH